MNQSSGISPAEIAAQRALDEVYESIRTRQSFRLEAGAGAGKTYSLVHALRMLIDEQEATLQRNGQRVACITFTNVATDEIVSRTDGHPVIYASTIHSFCWDLIKSFQPLLREQVSTMPAWQEKFAKAEIGGVEMRSVDYDLGHRRIDDDCVYLHHDDVLTLMVALMKESKFRRVFAARFPIVFIDEYQDTNEAFADSVMEWFIESGKGPLIGLFGDSWQKIYRDGKGSISHHNIKEIGKEANFRSAPVIVGALNKLRPELPQHVKDESEVGSVAVYHANGWGGVRRTGNLRQGDLPAEVAHEYLEALREHLAVEGWVFVPEQTKVLMLTHNVLAAEQDYQQIANLFRYNESFIKKEDPYIEFLVDTVEPACEAIVAGKYGEMFRAIGTWADVLRSHEDKASWIRDIRALVALRDSGTVGDVLDHLKETKRPRLSTKVKKAEDALSGAAEDEIQDSSRLKEIQALREIPYSEVIALARFVNDHTVFSTKHGVKGAEFENVLVVFGRGWNYYNWNQFLEWFATGAPNNKSATYERNRNLFYVACSRPKKRLALLFTQDLSQTALSSLSTIFGNDHVNPFSAS